MFLIIDNYDSFVYNLARYFVLAGVDCDVVRNDRVSAQDIERIAPEALVLSPGPCAPKDAGVCVEVIKHFGASVPILGVCLGHQAIVEAYGGRTVRSAEPVHGRSTLITHNGAGIFAGVDHPAKVGRYHSLVSEVAADGALDVTAQTDGGIVMAVQHKVHPVYGLQFHPESILTAQGAVFVENFVRLARAHEAAKEAA
ncbi:MAG: anthranilate synthase component II [Alphaproteobacteria bacterium]